MISGLLHGRILGGGPGPGLADNPAYVNLLGYNTGTSSASANTKFKLLTNGTWLGRGDAYTDVSGNYYLPTTVAIGSGYEAKATLTLLSGPAGTVTNPMSSFVAISSDRELIINVQRFTPGVSVSTYSVLIEIKPTGGSVESSFSFTMTTTADVNAGGGGGCPSIEMFVSQAKQVCDLGIGANIDAVVLEESELIKRLEIIGYTIGIEPCFRIRTRNGSSCVLSASTPFTLRDGSTKMMPEMLNEHVLRDDAGGPLKWDKVVECSPLGDKPVARVNVGGHSILCGEHPQMRILSHNSSKE